MSEPKKINKNKTYIKRALVSVFDKTGLPQLGKSLEQLGVEILSTGGSARTLREEGISVTAVSEYT